MSNLDLLKQGYKDFSEGNIEAAVSNWSPDIVWEECTGFPHIEGDGIFNGLQSVLEGGFALIPEQFENFGIEIEDFVDGGDKIVMVGYYSGIWKATGKSFKAKATHTWTFKDGKPVHFFQAVDTAAIIS